MLLQSFDRASQLTLTTDSARCQNQIQLQCRTHVHVKQALLLACGVKPLCQVERQYVYVACSGPCQAPASHCLGSCIAKPVANACMCMCSRYDDMVGHSQLESEVLNAADRDSLPRVEAELAGPNPVPGSPSELSEPESDAGDSPDASTKAGARAACQKRRRSNISLPAKVCH